MAGRGERAAEQRGDDRPRGVVAAEHRRGEHGAGGDADQGVQRVPDAVEAGDLVDEELDEEHDAAGAEQPRALEQVQSRRQVDPAERAGGTGEKDNGVQAQAARPAERSGDGDEVRQVEVHGRNQAGLRFSRKLATPSLPSALARMSAMRRAVSARSVGVISRPATSWTSCLQARVAIGPLATRAATISSILASSAACSHTSCMKPMALASAAPKRSAVTK